MQTPTVILITLAICGGIITLVNAAKAIADVIHAAKAPNNAQNERLDALEEQVKRHQEFLNADKRRIESLEAQGVMTLKVQFALLSHAINGNDMDNLRKVHTELQEFLANRGITV